MQGASRSRKGIWGIPVALPSREERYQPSFSSGYSKAGGGGGGGIIKERKCHQYSTKKSCYCFMSGPKPKIFDVAFHLFLFKMKGVGDERGFIGSGC